MSDEALVILDDDDETAHPATHRMVAAYITEARAALRHIVSTGNSAADGDILIAEQALRRALSTMRKT